MKTYDLIAISSFDKSCRIGAGQCVTAAPGSFARDDDDGLAIIEITAQRPIDVDLAILSCPTPALAMDTPEAGTGIDHKMSAPAWAN